MEVERLFSRRASAVTVGDVSSQSWARPKEELWLKRPATADARVEDAVQAIGLYVEEEGIGGAVAADSGGA